MKNMEIKKNKPIIIAIAGKKYSGKNTFGRFLQKALKEQYSIESDLVSFAGSIKEVVSLMTGIKNLENYKELPIKELVEYKEYSTPDYLVPLENLSKRDLMIKTAEALSGVYGKESFAKKLLSDNKDNKSNKDTKDSKDAKTENKSGGNSEQKTETGKNQDTDSKSGSDNSSVITGSDTKTESKSEDKKADTQAAPQTPAVQTSDKDLPKTGPAESLAAILAVGGLTFIVLAYVQSRRVI